MTEDQPPRVGSPSVVRDELALLTKCTQRFECDMYHNMAGHRHTKYAEESDDDDDEVSVRI